MHDEINLLVTPDTLHKPGLRFEPVFDYEQVLVVGSKHPLAGTSFIEPQQLVGEILITYPSRGVAALPRWLVEEYAARMNVVTVRLGAGSIAKQIFLGVRAEDANIDYIRAFVVLARGSTNPASP